MPSAMPYRVLSSRGEKPIPSSSTSTWTRMTPFMLTTRPRTEQLVAPACRPMFDSASWTAPRRETRTLAGTSVIGSTSTSTRVPVARRSATARSMSRSNVCAASPVDCVDWC